MKKISSIIFLLSFYLVGFAQIDMNQFQTIQASGDIPSDFTTTVQEKINNDHSQNKDLTKEEQEEFKKNIYFSVDQLLHSGQCVYGDPVSLYVQSVAKRLLKDKPNLFKELRFYTIKSNVVNAFSTKQGIVFITTGFIAQLSNESQLAFALAHEISHYTEHHVIKKFVWSKTNEDANVESFHGYSKEQEFDADKLASKMCLKAGYSANQLYNVFDVLMFSHLPFNEIKFDKKYFNTSLFFVPENEFTTKTYPIKMDDDWDDKSSSHPNIRKRKEEIRPLLSKHFGEGKAFLGSKDKFEEVRMYARFESVRLNILNNNMSRALYQIFLLKRKYPNNYTLARWEAHVWLGLLKAKKNNIWSKVTVAARKFEGESATLYKYIKDLNKDAVVAQALRTIEDELTKYPDSKELKLIKQKAMKTIASISNWSWTKYANKTFEEAITEQQKKLAKYNEKQHDILDKNDHVLTKYERIKGVGAEEKTTSFAKIDSSNYYYYGISDLMNDEAFLAQFKKYQDEYKAREEAKEKKGKDDNLVAMNIQKILVVDPFIEYNYKSKLDIDKLNKIGGELSTNITTAISKRNIDIQMVNRSSLVSGGTKSFNFHNTLISLLQEFATIKGEFSIVPVDYELIQDIVKETNTDKLLLSYVSYDKYGGSYKAVYLFLLYPFAVPSQLMVSTAANKTVTSAFVLFDMSQGKVQATRTNEYSKAGSKWMLRSELYNLLNTKIIAP